jgi:hypothetical protein
VDIVKLGLALTNRLLAMGVPPGAGGVVVTAAAPPDSSKRTKNRGRYFTSGARAYTIKPFNYD